MDETAAIGLAKENVQARALWFTAAGECRVLSETLPVPAAGELRVRTLFSGISRGTETLVFQGRVPATETERMRGPGMQGDFGFPVKYGYCAVGRVEHGAPHLLGRAVFCLHPHQDRFIIPEGMATPLPDAVPPARAVLCANMETALNIVWDAGILPGDRVAIFGAGVVGALVGFITSGICGAEPLLIDTNPERRSLAAALGIAFAGPGDLAGEFDVLVNASGSPDALNTAIDHAGQEARIVEASWHGDRQAKLMLGGAFHARRLSLVSSQVGAIPASRRVRWDFARRMAKAMELLSDDRLDALISGETAFADMAAAYPAILSDPQTLCHRIHY